MLLFVLLVFCHNIYLRDYLLGSKLLLLLSCLVSMLEMLFLVRPREKILLIYMILPLSPIHLLFFFDMCPLIIIILGLGLDRLLTLLLLRL